VHALFKTESLESRLRHVRQHWQSWLEPAIEALQKLPEKQRDSILHSQLIIKAHCDERGSILASGDSSIFNYGRDYYCYCWPRDASYALWPLIRLGHFDEAKQFFEFARDTMHHDGYLMHKYQPDRAVGSTWHPLVHNRHKELAIQEDETASVVFMIHEFYEASHDRTFVENLYHSFIVPCANFMCRFIDEATGLPHASYDLWEERFLTSTYTVCAIIAALEAAAKLAEVVEQPSDATRWSRTAGEIQKRLDTLYHPNGYFRKGFLLQPNGKLEFDDTLDISSLYGPFMYARLSFDDPRLTSTVKQVEEHLLNTSPIGGVIRYPGDNYFLAKQQYPGNPWIVCSLWLAQYYLASGKADKATPLLEWALDRQLPSGALSEQFDPEDGTSISVTPLVWSHAELINTVLDINSNKL
jgi:GH15 family glucan-1,4-alpha-glucosidase